MKNEIVKIISYLNILELPVNTLISKESITIAYRKLAHIYHPDVANTRYKDGEKFKKLQEAKDYLLNNINYVNDLIRNDFSSTDCRTNNSYDYENWKQQEEFKRRKAEEDRLRKEREEIERRRQEELKRQREAEEKRIREEQELKKKIYELKENKINVAKKILDTIKKEDYSENNYNRICSAVMSFVAFLNDKNDLSINIINEKYDFLCAYLKTIHPVNYYKMLNRIKLITMGGLSCIALFALVIMLLVYLIIPNSKYNQANKYMENEQFLKANEIYAELSDFKESKNYSEISIYLHTLQNRINDTIIYDDVKYIETDCRSYNIRSKYYFQNIDYGDNFDFINSKLEKDGYIFRSWKLTNFDYDISNNVLIINLDPYFEKLYCLSLYDNDYLLYEKYLPEGEYIDTNHIKKNGYTLTGWYDSTKSYLKTFNMPTEDIKLFASWSLADYNIEYKNIDEYTVTFVTNSFYGNIIKVANPFEPVYPPSYVFKNNYVFVGWYEDEDLSRKYDFSEPIDKDIKLYAKWHLCDDTIKTTIMQPKKDYNIMCSTYYGASSSLRTVFVAQDNGEHIVNIECRYDPTVIKSGLAGDSEMYHTYYNNPYTIKINGLAINTSKKYCHTLEEKIVLQLKEGDFVEIIFYSDFLKIDGSGYTEYGYYRDYYYNSTSCNVSYTNNAPKKEIKVVEQVIDNPKIYTINDVILLRDPKKNGYEFLGWYLDMDFQNKISIIKESTGDLILYAKWGKIE